VSRILVRVLHGIVADITTALVAQAPDFEWNEMNGVANVIRAKPQIAY
jgi:hypothetical protein